MLYELEVALTARFNSSAGATLRGLVQGMWPGETPSSLALATQAGEELERSTLPIISFTEVTTGLQQDTCSNIFEPVVQFTIFDDGNNKSARRALLVGVEFLEVFGDQILTMTNSYTMIRNDTTDMRKFKDTNKFHNVVYELSFQIEKDR